MNQKLSFLKIVPVSIIVCDGDAWCCFFCVFTSTCKGITEHKMKDIPLASSSKACINNVTDAKYPVYKGQGCE